MCKNDCILYRGLEYEDLEKYPICGLERFNCRKDNDDDENCNRNRRKDEPKKVFWYLYEICSMCENMIVSEVCALFEVLCLVFDGHYTKSGN
jgi:hypothetical protein